MSQASDKKWLADAIGRWRRSPATMVRELFKVEPDPWQTTVLEEFPRRPYMALLACKGPGKTTCLAWLGWNFLLTRKDANIGAVSIDGKNLRDNLWKEMAKWRNAAPLLQMMFEINSEMIFCKESPKTWFMTARTWPKTADQQEQSKTLAGLHADYIMFILDESGGIPDTVMVAAEAALSSCKEGHILQAGNPTNLDGPLYRAHKDRIENGGAWFVVEITGDPDDPQRSPRVSIDWARDQIRKYGRDNPWVLVNVFGKFPPSSISALIGDGEVLAAMRRAYRPWEYRDYAKVMACDVARQGDDSSVIARRQGPQMFTLSRHRNVPDGHVGASITNRLWNEFDADACFIDATGGFGFPWIDCLKPLGKAAIGVGFANEAARPDRYYNKRAEMAFEFIEWIKQGGALPPESTEGAHELREALVKTTYTFKGDRLILEDKSELKARLGFSPDEFDAAMMTFAEPVSPTRSSRQRPAARSAMLGGYDPFAEMNTARSGNYPTAGPASSYNPFA